MALTGEEEQEQVVFAYNPWDEWTNPIGVALMPAVERFQPGDMVVFKGSRFPGGAPAGDVGLIVAVFDREVEYSGLSTCEPEDFQRMREEEDGKKTGSLWPTRRVMMRHYAVLWGGKGTIRIAPECHASQLERRG